jgi:hypothetical protein
MKKIIFIYTVFLSSIYNISAQTGFESLFLADKNDSQKILEAYFSPRINGYMNTLNNGWYHTAEVHKPFGFDFSVNLNSVSFPKNKRTFNVSGLTSVNQPQGNVNNSTSVGNGNSTTATVNTTINNEDVSADIILPSGGSGKLFSNSASIPLAQLNVGLSNKFELIVRITPQVKINNSNESLNLFGFGLKKEITNWFSSLKDSPLHVSVLAAYSNMNLSYGIEDKDLPSGNTAGLEVRNAITEFNLKTFTLQTLASYHWSTLNLYGGLAYNNGNASYKTLGEFTGQFVGNTGAVTKDIDTSNTLDFNSSGISATIGARLNLRYFKIFSSYSLQEFNTFNIGAAISIK